MTDIIPRLNAASLGTIAFRELPDVQPFSIRSGYSYESILSDIRVWIRDELVPYLQDNSAAAIFSENVDRMVDAVNAALTTQSGIVTTALNAAVQEVITAQVPVADPLVLAVLNAVSSQTRDYLDARYLRYTPPPTGGDDTAMLMPYLLAAQSTGGTMTLGAGEYRANLATAQSFQQPKIVGRGGQRTSLRPFDKTKPALVFQGGSGGESGGYYSDIQFLPHADGGGVGVALRDVCHVHWDRVRFEQGFDTAISFEVTQAGGFTEFCSGEATIQAGTGLALRYSTVKSSETSFHGSGLTNGVVNYSGAFCIQIEDNCFPYNAPLSATFFTHAPNSQLIRNRNTHREVSFFGTLRLEHQTSGYTILGAVGDGHNSVLYVGSLSILAGPIRLGNFKELTDLEYVGGDTFKTRKPFTTQQAMANGAVSFELGLEQGEFALVAVNIIGPNFTYKCVAMVWRDPFSSGGVVNKIDENLINNTGGGGSASLSVQNGAFVITNAYQTTYTGTVTVTPLGSKIAANALRQ